MESAGRTGPIQGAGEREAARRHFRHRGRGVALARGRNRRIPAVLLVTNAEARVTVRLHIHTRLDLVKVAAVVQTDYAREAGCAVVDLKQHPVPARGHTRRPKTVLVPGHAAGWNRVLFKV